jgi:cytosine/creatinine deaminase
MKAKARALRPIPRSFELIWAKPSKPRNKVLSVDLILKNARLPQASEPLFDIGLANGTIAAIQSNLAAEAPSIDLGGKLVAPGFVETHIHLDKSNILSRCAATGGNLDTAIAEVAQLKKAFTSEDVYARAERTLRRCIVQGTTHMRTHLEVDPAIDLRSFDAIKQLAADYRWAVDLQICVFPQEGLLNYPGTEELLIAALKRGAPVLGATPYTDSDPHGQIDRIFEIAREFDADIDMHLDFSLDPENMDLLYVCEKTEEFHYGGRVAIGHVTKLSAVPPDVLHACAQRLANAGVALTVLPSTDLYLMGRHVTHNAPRGVTPAHDLLKHGVNCSLATNNVLNPFTPFGDCSLIRMANLYANICHVAPGADIRACFDMITGRPARLMNLRNYGLEVGMSADLLVLDAETPEAAVAEVSAVLYAFKRGVNTMTRPAPRLHEPGSRSSQII